MPQFLAPALIPILGPVGGYIAAYFISAVGATILANAIAGKDKGKQKVSVQFETEFGDNLPLRFTMGRYVTGGQRKYIGSWGKNNRYIPEVSEYSALPQGVAGMWVNDEPADIDWGRTVTDGTSHNLGHPISNYERTILGQKFTRLWVKVVPGTQAAADPLLTGVFGSDKDYPWTADFVGKGKSYVIITTRYDSETLTSYPAYLIEPAPLPLYDPRKDSTNGGSGPHRWGQPGTYEPSHNPAVMAYNIARGVYYGGEWVFGGKNLPAWRLPVAEWIAAANACDAAVPLAGGGTEPAYRAGLEVTADMTPADVLEVLGMAANMRFAEVGGRLKPAVGLPVAPVLHIRDEDIIITEGQSYRPFTALNEAYNALSATYPEPGEKWANKDAPEYVDTEATARDGGRYLPTSVTYAAVPYGSQVQRLTRSQLRDYRRERQHQFYLPPHAGVLEPGVDTIAYSSTRNGYSSKRFLVENVVKGPGMLVAVTLREVEPGDYDWSSDWQAPITITPPVNVVPWEQTISGLTVTRVAIEDADSTARRPGIQVSCDGTEEGIESIWIQCRQPGQTLLEHDAPGAFVEPYTWLISNVLPNTDYEVRAKVVSELTPKSAWSQWLGVRTLDIRLTEDDLGQSIRDKLENAISGAIEATDFAAGIRPVEVLSALPGAPHEEGRIVFLTTDHKLYRNTGSGWTAIVPAEDIDGQITGTQISNNAITAPKINAGAVNANNLAANAVIAGKIAAGAVNTDQLAANAVTAEKAYFESLAALDLVVESADIVNLAVERIKIANGAVTDRYLIYATDIGHSEIPPVGSPSQVRVYPLDDSLSITIPSNPADVPRDLWIDFTTDGGLLLDFYKSGSQSSGGYVQANLQAEVFRNGVSIVAHSVVRFHLLLSGTKQVMVPLMVDASPLGFKFTRGVSFDAGDVLEFHFSLACQNTNETFQIGMHVNTIMGVISEYYK